MLNVRAVTIDDVAAYRDLHRYGLIEAPLAFVETPDEDAAREDSVVAAMLLRGDGWGVFEADRLVGKLVIDSLPYACLTHTRWLHAVYVHPDARGRGAADRLLATAIEHARSNGALRVALCVNAQNAPASKFYERHGFELTGRVPGGIKVGGTLVDDLLMTRTLD